MKTLTLSNDHLSLVILPEVGGKIASLRSLSSGREWLWTNPHLPTALPVYGASYVEKQDFGGWDEIFPSVSPAQVAGFGIPDHGDLAVLPWEVLEQSNTRVKMAVTTRFAPVMFERTLTLEGAQLQADYRMTNLGNKPVPYLWCAHPLVALEPGMTIELPAGTPMRIDGGVNVPVGKDFSWPFSASLSRHMPDGGPLSRIPNPKADGFLPFAAKLFTAKGAVGEVAIGSPDGREKLRLTWDAADAPYLGLWLNCMGWSGCGSAPYFNMGVEPATAPFDDLGAAMMEGSGRWLGAGESRAWALGVALECKMKGQI